MHSYTHIERELQREDIGAGLMAKGGKQGEERKGSRIEGLVSIV